MCGLLWPHRMQCSRADMSEGIRIPENGYSDQSIQFMDKVMEISGLGDQTFLPDGVPPSVLITIIVGRQTTF